MNPAGQPIEELHDTDPAHALAEVNGRATPAVFRGLCADWPLVRHADNRHEIRRYLLDHYQGAPVTAFISAPETGGRIFYNEDISRLDFQQIRTRLDEVLSRLEAAAEHNTPPTIYMGSMAIDHCLPGIKADNSLPEEHLSPSVRIWIGNRTKVAAHYDVMDNIAVVCAGRRRFTLFPPDQLANLYLGPIDLTPAGQQVSLVDPDNSDFDRFPRYREALEHSQTAELEPGDAIYIPGMWWHQVNALAPFNILINHWWRDLPNHMDAPGDVLLHALLNLRDLPERQRDAWRELFEHYVFNPPDGALDHIPEQSRGVLGGLDDTHARQLRALLRKRLNR